MYNSDNNHFPSPSARTAVLGLRPSSNTVLVSGLTKWPVPSYTFNNYYTINNFPWGQHGKMKDPRPGTRGGLTWPRPRLTKWPVPSYTFNNYIHLLYLHKDSRNFIGWWETINTHYWLHFMLITNEMSRVHIMTRSIFNIDPVNIQYWPG